MSQDCAPSVRALSLRKVWTRTLLLFVALLLVGAMLVVLSEKVRYERLRNEAIRLSAEQGLLIQRQINQGLSAVHVIAALVRQGGGSITNFKRIAQGLLPFYDGLASLQLAPDAIVRQIVPLKGSEKAIGHNLLADEKRATEARMAIETRKMTLAGPFMLVQGGYGIVGRLPVFLDDPKAVDQQRFWGFAIALIKVDRLLEAATLQNLSAHGYRYELWREHPDTHEREIFARSSPEPLIDAQDFAFEVPNGRWVLSIAPQRGWTDHPLLFGKIALAVILSILFAWTGHAIIRQPMLLHQMVEARTLALTEANERILRNEQKFRSLVETASETIYTLDTNGMFCYVSPAGEEMFGAKPESWVGRSFLQLLHPDDIPAFNTFFQQLLTEPVKHSSIEFRIRHTDGSWRWHVTNASPLLDQNNKLTGMLGIGRDISKRKANEARIFHLAHFDSLTDLPNRSLFSDRLQQALQLAHRNHEKVTLMCVDLDYFKPINDTWGHAIGDEVLKQVAQRMVACVRASDTVGRIGGDEFVVLLPESHEPEEILRVAEAIRQSLAETFIVGELRLSISSCIGVATYPEHGSDPTSLSRNADQAMYQAKESGRNRVCVFQPPDTGTASKI